jgi:hypothetical protein
MTSIREAFGKLGKILYGTGRLLGEGLVGAASMGIGVIVHGYEIARGLYDRSSSKYLSGAANLLAFVYVPALYLVSYIASLGYDMFTNGTPYLTP